MEDQPLKDLLFAFAGTLNNMTRVVAKASVEALGGRVTGAVYGNVDVVVVGEDPGSKLSKADQLKIMRIDEQQFNDLIEGRAKILGRGLEERRWARTDEPAQLKWEGWDQRDRIDGPLPKTKERIIAAAIQIEGVTVSLPLPARHGQVLHAALNMHLPDHMVTTACQGFLTSTGRFVNRVQAKQIAHMAGQPQMRPESERTKDLYSEDLW